MSSVSNIAGWNAGLEGTFHLGALAPDCVDGDLFVGWPSLTVTKRLPCFASFRGNACGSREAEGE
jgi:hypothetical protein